MIAYLQWKAVYDLSSGSVFNDLYDPNVDFKGTPLFEVEYLRNDTK